MFKYNPVLEYLESYRRTVSRYYPSYFISRDFFTNIVPRGVSISLALRFEQLLSAVVHWILGARTTHRWHFSKINCLPLRFRSMWSIYMHPYSETFKKKKKKRVGGNEGYARDMHHNLYLSQWHFTLEAATHFHVTLWTSKQRSSSRRLLVSIPMFELLLRQSHTTGILIHAFNTSRHVWVFFPWFSIRKIPPMRLWKYIWPLKIKVHVIRCRSYFVLCVDAINIKV